MQIALLDLEYFSQEYRKQSAIMKKQPKISKMDCNIKKQLNISPFFGPQYNRNRPYEPYWMRPIQLHEYLPHFQTTPYSIDDEEEIEYIESIWERSYNEVNRKTHLVEKWFFRDTDQYPELVNEMKYRTDFLACYQELLSAVISRMVYTMRVGTLQSIVKTLFPDTVWDSSNFPAEGQTFPGHTWIASRFEELTRGRVAYEHAFEIRRKCLKQIDAMKGDILIKRRLSTSDKRMTTY